MVFSDKKQFVNNDDAYWASVKAARYLALTGKGSAFPADKYSYKQAMELFRGGFSSGSFWMSILEEWVKVRAIKLVFL